MTKFVNSVKNFLVSEDGPTAVEYAIMLTLISLACIVGATAVGTAVDTRFTGASTTISGT